MSNIDKQQIRDDIAIRKSMPCFGVSPDHSLARLKAIQETQRSFGLEVVEALLDELEAKDKRIAELSSLQGKPIAWESTTPVYVKFITDERYQRLRPGYKKWYKPYRCSLCAAAGKGE